MEITFPMISPRIALKARAPLALALGTGENWRGPACYRPRKRMCSKPAPPAPNTQFRYWGRFNRRPGDF